jgi:hypothetical protein
MLVGIAFREAIGILLDALFGRKQPATVPPLARPHPEYRWLGGTPVPDQVLGLEGEP